MLETTNKTYHLSSAQDPQGGNCYSNQRPNRPITPTKNNPYCIGYDSPNSKKHRVSVPAHFTRSRGNPYPSCVRLRRLRRLCLGFGVGSLQPLQDFRLAMVDPVVTDVEQTWVSTSLIGRWAQQSDFLCRVISQRKIMVPYFQSPCPENPHGILWQNVTWGANCVADSCKIRPLPSRTAWWIFDGLTNENVRVFSKSSPPISVSPNWITSSLLDRPGECIEIWYPLVI